MSHKLLLADDSVTIQRVIELTFADEDVEVSAVGNGQQAIARIVSDPPDIVLADVGMPEQDGYEVAAFVKNRPDLAHIPVLLLTGAFEPVDEARAEAARCDGVLAKPFEPQLLITRVKELLPSRARQAAPAGAALPPGFLAAQAAADATGEEETGLDMHALLDAAPARHPDADVSLDDYFDRLDRAFADLAGTKQGPAAIPGTPAPTPAAAAPIVAT
ncbi:MAG TPA: response regulator, partial [Vicinamibacterales bacterium]|nr:response regulator [Vicinamibacterales bacterium]